MRAKIRKKYLPGHRVFDGCNCATVKLTRLDHASVVAKISNNSILLLHPFRSNGYPFSIFTTLKLTDNKHLTSLSQRSNADLLETFEKLSENPISPK